MMAIWFVKGVTQGVFNGRHARHLRTALTLAATSECRTRHGAIVVKAGKVVARATNRTRGILDGDPLVRDLHAEVRALRRVADPRGAVIYVARVTRSGEPALSEPCPACRVLLDAAGVRAVWTQ